MSSLSIARILIVDDEAANMRALCETLRDRGYETEGATDGHAALEALAREPFDLLLTDLMMPGMNGVELLSAALQVDPQLVAVLMTGQGTVETAVAAMQAGAIDYVLKPIKLGAIIPVLSRALDIRRLRQENLELRNTMVIHELNQAIAYTLDINVLLDKIADATLGQLEADEVSIMLASPEGEYLQIAAVRGAGRESLLGLRVPFGQAIAGTVALRRAPVILDGEVKDPALAPVNPRADIRSALSMPMISRGKLVGVINASSLRRPKAFPLGRIKGLSIFTNAAAAGIEAARMHEEQRRSETRLCALLESVRDYAIFMLDPKGRIVTWNDGARELTGFTENDILGRPFSCFFTAEDVAAGTPTRLLTEAGLYGRAEDEGWRLRSDGVRFHTHSVITAMRDPAGQLLGFAAITHDVTERVLAAQRLQAQMQRAEALLQAAPDPVVIVDEEGRVAVVNARAEEVFGWSRDEMVGHPVEMLIPPARRGGHVSMRHSYVSAPRARAMGADRELFACRKDGSVFPVDVSLSPLLTPEGTLVISMIRDVTDRRRIEREIRELNVTLERRVAERTLQLEEANRAKSDFLANMSHELRTPLNSIIGFSEMLNDGVVGDLSDKQRRFCADIFDAGTHLLSLINDILDLSKVEAGMLQLETAPVDVVALLKASTLVVRERALKQRIRLSVDVHSRLDTMLSDERKLKQIVYNLLSNAVKFTPEGGSVALRAWRCMRDAVALAPHWPGRLLPMPSDGAQEFLAVEVEDSGIGIAEDDLHRLFEPFVQVDGSATRRHSGTGLGLALVRRLAELHGGTVGISSSPGAGTSLRVFVPYLSAAVAGGEPPATAGRSRGEDAPVPLALVIEDDDRMAETISTQLRDDGFQVLRAATAEEGLVLAVRKRPAVITLDIFLPLMDGWEFMRRLRAEPSLTHTPVVIITVSPDLDHGLALGARRVLQKPFVREELTSALAGLVAPHRDGSPPTVLVVDDNVRTLDLLTETLTSGGYTVVRAYSGAEAIEAAQDVLPDLVILDLFLSDAGGFEVARALRESPDTAGIPIVVLAARDLEPEDRAQLNGHVNVVLERSRFSTTDILAELHRVIGARTVS
ncbi:MAG: response regulator [Betaproteobacteria bacterium]|nr:response regulator [Betaproteobacteria bacterium]